MFGAIKCTLYYLRSIVSENCSFGIYNSRKLLGHVMGCLHSRNEASDLHPNVFRVVNINENGSELCSGQLEITESTIVLYREGRETTVWPLHSLRRYGFEGEIFSFESGSFNLHLF